MAVAIVLGTGAALTEAVARGVVGYLQFESIRQAICVAGLAMVITTPFP